MAKKRLSKSSLLWFIRSRSYVTIPDLRRRFNVDRDEDILPMEGPGGRVYVGLPKEPRQMLQDLWREGKVGLEMSVDIRAPVVLGVFSINYRAQGEPHQGVRPESGESETGNGSTAAAS